MTNPWDGGFKRSSSGELLVESSTPVQTAFTYTDGLLTGYVENGQQVTIARNADGTIASVTKAAA